jgi:hypothetical protein
VLFLIMSLSLSALKQCYKTCKITQLSNHQQKLSKFF